MMPLLLVTDLAYGLLFNPVRARCALGANLGMQWRFSQAPRSFIIEDMPCGAGTINLSVLDNSIRIPTSMLGGFYFMRCAQKGRFHSAVYQLPRPGVLNIYTG